MTSPTAQTLAQTTLKAMVRIVDARAEKLGLRLSNKHVGDDVVSYRLWPGVTLPAAELAKLMAELQAKQSQPIRWYDHTKVGKGSVIYADMMWSRNLGLGQDVAVIVEVLRTEVVMLRLVANVSTYVYSRFS